MTDTFSRPLVLSGHRSQSLQTRPASSSPAVSASALANTAASISMADQARLTRPASGQLPGKASDGIRFDMSSATNETNEAHASKSSRSLLDIIIDIIKAIIEILLAPFKFLLGLFGVGSSPGAPKLSAAEKLNGRKMTRTASGAADTGQFGPFGVEKHSIMLPTANGGSTPADLYIPRGRGPFPAMIHSYGLFSNKENHTGTASHYASWGMVVIVPSLPHGGGSPSENAPELSHWIQWLQSRPASLPPLALERGIGLSGHSFGGLSSILAGSSAGVGCIVALDPADAFDKGEAMASQLQVPSAFIVGDRSLANQFGNGRDIYQAAGGPKQLIHIKEAKHVDFENKSDDGPKNLANQAAMRQAVGFMLKQLTGRPEFAAYEQFGTQTELSYSD